MTEEQMNIFRKEFLPRFCTRISANQLYWLSITGIKLIERYSNLAKVLCLTAYFFKAIEIMKKKKPKPTQPIHVQLTNQEMNNALNYWIRYTQLSAFNIELGMIESKQELPKSSVLRKMCPFIDAESILRVRGRLSNAEVTYDEKYPIIIPGNSAFGKLLLQEAHEKTLHGNIQLMLNYANSRYWIISGRTAARDVVKRCVMCLRYAKQEQQQLMGDLPKERVLASAPFTHCGVDLFGPVKIKRYEHRCRVEDKGYVVVFVCMATKMVHMECVSDMSTRKFTWALERLSSVYHTPEVIWSDNAKYFKGTENELKDAVESWNTKELCEFLSLKNIEWKYICPRAPFQGGIWESAVKSAKYHLNRILNGYSLTFERLSTLLYKVSSVLNSRPLIPLTSDPFDLNYMTPSRAFSGEKSVQPLARNFENVPINKIIQQRLIDKIHQDFWSVWSKEYLRALQNRYKWQSKEENLEVGDFVIIKEDNIPPNKWYTARVIETYPSKDGLVRNVKLRTAQSDLKRPVQKLIRLRINDEN